MLMAEAFINAGIRSRQASKAIRLAKERGRIIIAIRSAQRAAEKAIRARDEQGYIDALARLESLRKKLRKLSR